MGRHKPDEGQREFPFNLHVGEMSQKQLESLFQEIGNTRDIRKMYELAIAAGLTTQEQEDAILQTYIREKDGLINSRAIEILKAPVGRFSYIPYINFRRGAFLLGIKRVTIAKFPESRIAKLTPADEMQLLIDKKAESKNTSKPADWSWEHPRSNYKFRHYRPPLEPLRERTKRAVEKVVDPDDSPPNDQSPSSPERKAS